MRDETLPLSIREIYLDINEERLRGRKEGKRKMKHNQKRYIEMVIMNQLFLRCTE